MPITLVEHYRNTVLSLQ